MIQPVRDCRNQALGGPLGLPLAVALLIIWAVAVLAPPAHAQASVTADKPQGERLQVVDAFIELRTGPGRGYPIFFVAERGQWVQVELRHTDWYRVRTDNDRVGWVHRAQLETTFTEAGERKSFRDIALDDYLRRRLEMGGAWGRFKGEPMLKIWSGYRLSDTLGVEGTIGQVQGLFSGTDFWHLNLGVEPWSDQRASPYFGIGFGKFKNFPNQSLVSAINTNAKLANASLGLRYYVSERFVVRVDYTLYTAFLSDTRSTEYRAKTLGLAFFF